MVKSDLYADYLLHPNESIDKLAVNRILYRLFKLASEYDNSVTELTITKATSSTYGLVKRSALSSYQYMVDDTETYYYRTIGLSQILDYAKGEYVKRSMYDVVGVTSEARSQNPKCLCMSIGDCSFLHMPNGVRMLTFSFDLGVNGLFGMFGSDVASGSYEVPVTVRGYEEELPLDVRTSRSLNSVYGNTEDSMPLSALFGSTHTNQTSSSYIGDVTAAIRQHTCNWLSYSSYSRSCVELTYSVSFSVRDLYDRYYSYERRTLKAATASQNVLSSYNTEFFKREFDAFQSNPIILPQLTFYNTDSMPDYYIGTYDKDSQDGTFNYFHGNTVGQSPMTCDSVDFSKRGGVKYGIPKANGDIIVRKIESDYRKDGHRRDNVVSFDVVFRFDAGDADDPCKDIAMRTMRAKANVQLMMIGV